MTQHQVLLIPSWPKWLLN